MANDLATFVAEDLWLFVAIATFFTAGLLAIIGFQTVVAMVAFVGWFFLTPVFLFWGEEIAAWLYGYETDEDDATQTTRGTASHAEQVPEDDPLERLKHRYATGELSDEEFEHRLDRLIEVDDRYERREDVSGGFGTDSSGLEEREFERERR
ncbi:SHOCT domain-containing protein [Natrialbaceae archaeon A-CW3]